jgi:uncharacterized membrane protein YhaH (DUF805 family)
MGWYLGVFKKYAVFTGRARRKEYWMFTLFNFIVACVLGLFRLIPVIGGLFGILSIIYGLGMIIPALAVVVRRLHDTGRAWPFLFLALIPLVGWIIMLIFLVQDSSPAENKYGPNPKEAVAAKA